MLRSAPAQLKGTISTDENAFRDLITQLAPLPLVAKSLRGKDGSPKKNDDEKSAATRQKHHDQLSDTQVTPMVIAASVSTSPLPMELTASAVRNAASNPENTANTAVEVISEVDTPQEPMAQLRELLKGAVPNLMGAEKTEVHSPRSKSAKDEGLEHSDSDHSSENDDTNTGEFHRLLTAEPFVAENTPIPNQNSHRIESDATLPPKHGQHIAAEPAWRLHLPPVLPTRPNPR